MMWKVIGQSATGMAHKQIDKGCDDANMYKTIGKGPTKSILLAAVSDGAGSAMKSADGAQLAVATVISAAENMFEASDYEPLSESDLIALAEYVHEAIAELAQKDGYYGIEEYACTLLFAAITPNSAAYIQIGDGVIITSDGGDGYGYVWWPDNGEYLNTTSFITDLDYMANLRVKVVASDIKHISLLTDGLQQLTLNYEHKTVHKPFFDNLIQVLKQAQLPEHLEILNRKLNEYLQSDAINNRTDDDKTIILASRQL